MIRWAFAEDLCDIVVLCLANKIILIIFMDGLSQELFINLNSEKTKFYLKVSFI